ncbi:hypothetical protein FBU30_003804 [Linnemannia zychae]|nr:hypothetical protein FBU30_003804 [Linnemannia zychae]
MSSNGLSKNAKRSNITVNFERSNNAEDFYFDLGGSILANADNDAYNDISYLQFPRLKSLFATSWTRTLIRLHPTFLARCPNLEHIVLPDDGDREVSEVNTFGEPAELPNLLVLELSCHSALSFHPDTLKSTKRLERLTLYANEAEHHDNQDSKSDNTTLTIFSVQRPIWTWDWNLPNLTYLRLCVAFGYRFQFRMLEGTPSLRELIVDSNSNVHRRIGFEDLIKPGFHHSQLDRFLCRFGQKRKEASFILAETTNDQMGNDKNEDNTVDGNIWEEFEYIHLPLLESFMLSGKWELDERALQVLFKKVMPHVQKLDILFCIGYSLSEWVESTSLYLHELREARTNISKTSQMIADSGLVEKARPGYYNTWYILAVQPKDRLLNTPAYYDLL